MNDQQSELLNITEFQDFSPLIKNFLDKVIFDFKAYLQQNKLLIINYYLCAENELTEEEKRSLIFLKEKNSTNIKTEDEGEGNEDDIKMESEDSSVCGDNILGTNQKLNRRGRGKEITKCPHVDKKHYAKVI